jgi:glucokinase-like ROK family protein
LSNSEGSRFQTGDQTLLRRINLSAIMNHIREEAPVSRTDLAVTTGLNKTTVSSLVNELIHDEFVREVGIKSGEIGRPRVMLSINPKAGFILSAEIGVDFILVIATDFEPRVVYQFRQELTLNEEVDIVLNKLIELIQGAVEYCQAQGEGKLLGLAVGVPGVVDFTVGRLLFAPNLGWRDVPLRKILQNHFENIHITVDNEANMAALGEYYFGSAYKVDDFLYLSSGVGLGGGIVRQGRLFRGVKGMAGEIGHIIMDPDGILCGCGNRGCWETQVSQKALFRYVEEMINAGAESLLNDVTDGDLMQLSVDKIVEAAKLGDRVAIDALTKVAHHLAIGIASLINVLNPQLVVFGGILSAAWEFIKPVLDQDLQVRSLLWERQKTDVVLAKHQVNACVMGGVATVYQEII